MPAEEKNQQYWAKGTGFGTGSTMSNWDSEQTMMRKRVEEEHVTCLLQVSVTGKSWTISIAYLTQDYMYDRYM